MKKLVAVLALTTLFASPAFARTRLHHPGLVPLAVTGSWHGLLPAITTWHDDARWPQPPRATGTYARAQDGRHYAPVDTYDVVLNGETVGRDPDPNIRFQLLREASQPTD